jgi:hypothetical protein
MWLFLYCLVLLVTIFIQPLGVASVKPRTLIPVSGLYFRNGHYALRSNSPVQTSQAPILFCCLKEGKYSKTQPSFSSNICAQCRLERTDLLPL